MRTAAVLPALGIGDALLMMIASHQLSLQGYQVTTYHDALPELSSWFPGHTLQKLPQEEKWIETLSSYDLILVENDNSSKMQQLIGNFRERLSIFYPSYLKSKHAPLHSFDQVFDQNIPMADNIAKAIASFLLLPSPSKENGLRTPTSALRHRNEMHQILIHPTSRVPAKNWTAKRFITLAKLLSSKGFTPLFCVSPAEAEAWKCVELHGFRLAISSSLSELASFIYESGFVIGNDSLAGHLASNLEIPTLIIANDERRMRLWRPGWLKGQLVLPLSSLPNWKLLRLREKHWQHFISSKKVLKKFDQLQNSAKHILK